jgi:hypothetical protein
MLSILPRGAFGGELSALCGWDSFAASLLEPVAVAMYRPDVDAVRDPIKLVASEGCRVENWGRMRFWRPAAAAA